MQAINQIIKPIEQIIKPIETRYNGFSFRSRLEARWAIFFDTLGIKYEYEPEGFDLSGIPHIDQYLSDYDTWYLPDFRLPSIGCYMEIKPLKLPVDSIAVMKCYLLAQKENVLITYGTPGPDSYRIVDCNAGIERPDFWQHKLIDIAYGAAREARF